MFAMQFSRRRARVVNHAGVSTQCTRSASVLGLGEHRMLAHAKEKPVSRQQQLSTAVI